jgi:SAM-dependent methyltransferase
MSGNFYRAFEDRYRGSRELIKERLRAYAPFTTPLAALHHGAPALDLGCGRGEWLELSGEQGFAASGVDLDEGMLSACRERGLQVQTIDALSALRALPDASLALVSAFHLVEHLSFDDVQQLIAETLRVLRPGGLLIMETPNPENLVVGTNNFYLDPSHIKPVPPMLLDFMADYAGFTRHKVVRLQGAEATGSGAPVGLINVLQDVSADYGVVAQKLAEPALLAAFDSVFDATYGTALVDIAARFDDQVAQQHQATAAAIDAMHQQHASTYQHVGSSMETVHAGLSALSHAEQNHARALAGLDQAVQNLAEQTNLRMVAAEASNAELWTVSLPAMEQQIQDSVGNIERTRAELDERFTAVDQRIEKFERQVQDAIEQLEQRTERRIEPMAQGFQLMSERRGRTERAEQIAEREHSRTVEAEMRLAEVQQQLYQANLHLQQLDQHIKALHRSTSWRITAPVRILGSLARRTLAAVRDGRVKSALGRRLANLSTPADPAAGQRGWRARVKNNSLARRIALPLLDRFPALRRPMRHVMGSGAPHIPVSSKPLADWPGPLPEEYLHMPQSSRKVLLDLARAAQEQTHT